MKVEFYLLAGVMIAPFLASVALSGALPTHATCHVMMTLLVHMSCLLKKIDLE